MNSKQQREQSKAFSIDLHVILIFRMSLMHFPSIKLLPSILTFTMLACFIAAHTYTQAQAYSSASLNILSPETSHLPLMKRHQFAEAEKLMNQKIAFNESSPSAWVAKVDIILAQENQSRYDEAIQLATQCTQKFKDYPDCYEALAHAYLHKATESSLLPNLGLTGKIKENLQKSIALNPQQYTARHQLLEIHLNSPTLLGGGKDKAKELIVDGIRTHSMSGALLQAVYDLHDGKVERAKDAILAIRVNEEHTPKLVTQYQTVAQAVAHHFMKIRKWDQAEIIFKEIMSRFPHESIGYAGLGRIYFERANYQDAISLLEKAIILENTPTNYFYLAQSYQATGIHDLALDTYTKAQQTLPKLNKLIQNHIAEQIKSLSNKQQDMAMRISSN